MPVQVPTRGERIRAEWGASVAKAVNGIGVCAPSGMLVRDGAYGQGFQPLPANRRDRRTAVSAYADNGCWKIGVDDADESQAEPRSQFLNTFYQIGGNVYEYPDPSYPDEFILQGELAEGQEYTDADRPFVALVVDMSPDDYGDAEVKGYKTLAAMKAASFDSSKYVKPLYKLSHDGGVVVDFRNMPTLAAAEFIPEE